MLGVIASDEAWEGEVWWKPTLDQPQSSTWRGRGGGEGGGGILRRVGDAWQCGLYVVVSKRKGVLARRKIAIGKEKNRTDGQSKTKSTFPEIQGYTENRISWRWKKDRNGGDAVARNAMSEV